MFYYECDLAGITILLLSGSEPGVCLLLGPKWLNREFFSALIVCELRALFFVPSQYVN